MHVGHVVAAGEIGGAERMLADLARSPETDAEHTIWLFSPSKPLAEMFRAAGLAVKDRSFVKENPIAFVRRSLGRADVAWLVEGLVRTKVDVVHLHTLGSQVLGTRAALAAKLPAIRTEHSTRVYDDPTAWPFSRWSLRRVARAVCVSEHVRQIAHAKAPWAKFEVIHNGVDTDRFTPSTTTSTATATTTMTSTSTTTSTSTATPTSTSTSTSTATPTPNLRLAITGRLEPRKGVDLALRAIARTDATLVVAGEGPGRSSLTELARTLGIAERVTFLGHVDDVRPTIARADAVVCSSRSEGLGVAFLEAMAMGRPVVGLRTGGVAEIVDERVAFLAQRSPSDDEGAVIEIADAIARAAADRPGLVARGASARERVVARFSRAAMGGAYGAVYRSVKDSRPSG